MTDATRPPSGQSIADLEQLARDLAKTTANLKQHIATEGLKLGAELGKSHAKAADDRIKEIRVELQRKSDEVVELRLQLEARDRAYTQLMNERNDLNRRLRNVRLCRPWTDSLGRKFVFCDELWHATDPEHNPAPAPVRLDGCA